MVLAYLQSATRGCVCLVSSLAQGGSIRRYAGVGPGRGAYLQEPVDEVLRQSRFWILLCAEVLQDMCKLLPVVEGFLWSARQPS